MLYLRSFVKTSGWATTVVSHQKGLLCGQLHRLLSNDWSDTKTIFYAILLTVSASMPLRKDGGPLSQIEKEAYTLQTTRLKPNEGWL